MTISSEMITLAQQVARRIDLPRITELWLPQPKPAGVIKDDFGFVFLEDGTAAPFYTELPGTRDALTREYASFVEVDWSVLETVEALSSPELGERAVALGAFNAMSQHVMTRAGFDPTVISASKHQPAADAPIGMVGFFPPLVERLVAAGHQIIVLEKQAERIPDDLPGLLRSENPRDLAGCAQVLCTASTLINGSLADLLNASDGVPSFCLIGPSSSGLPDVVFAYGVDETGGVLFPDTDSLRRQLSEHETWGKMGLKYQLTPAIYPGVDELLSAVSS